MAREPSALWLDRFILRLGTHMPVTIQQATDVAMALYPEAGDIEPEKAADDHAARALSVKHAGTERPA
jgi:hypothetical protein